MKVEALSIRGAALLGGDVTVDERGTFRRVVGRGQLDDAGLESHIDEVSTATNSRRGTIRGLHYQVEPYGEAKTLWCASGAVFDVIVDLRPDEMTYGHWESVMLSAAEPQALHVPRGVAHGYQTLDDDTELVYLISTPYSAQNARGLLWCDPTLAIPWPLPLANISERDREAPAWPPQL
jgi:dTDP-4-dehydrorhamnose 3,5-epimerase